MSNWSPAFQRHLWLGQAVVDLRPYLTGAGLVLPTRVLVQAGPTQVCEGTPALGQCAPSSARADRLALITINESVTNPLVILETLVHELIHAADDCRSAHGQWFEAWARALGLHGRLPATYAGPALVQRLQSIAGGLGRYPAAGIGFNVTTSGLVAA